MNTIIIYKNKRDLIGKIISQYLEEIKSNAQRAQMLLDNTEWACDGSEYHNECRAEYKAEIEAVEKQLTLLTNKTKTSNEEIIQGFKDVFAVFHPHVFGHRTAIQQYCDLVDKVEAICEENERLRKALDKIVSPIKYMQQEAKKEGAKLDGGYAIMLAKDAHYLQSIAQQALLIKKQENG